MKDLPRHQCLIYDGDPTRQLVALAASIHAHLQGKYRCLYLNSPSMVDGIRSYLYASGLNVSDEVFKKRLILSSDKGHLHNGVFDPQRMMDALGSALASALEDGYVGLWASGDMAWEFGDARDFSKLLEYERSLEAFFASHPTLRGVCQYHVDVLPKGVTQLAAMAHPSIYVNETLSKLNPDFVPA